MSDVITTPVCIMYFKITVVLYDDFLKAECCYVVTKRHRWSNFKMNKGNI